MVVKQIRIKKNGLPDRRQSECPLAKVARLRLEAMRNERITFALVGDPERCTNNCWQLRQQQQSEYRAHAAYGNSVQSAQFPMHCLRSADELTDNFRGFLMTCSCLTDD